MMSGLVPAVEKSHSSPVSGVPAASPSITHSTSPNDCGNVTTTSLTASPPPAPPLRAPRPPWRASWLPHDEHARPIAEVLNPCAPCRVRLGAAGPEEPHPVPDAGDAPRHPPAGGRP